MNTEVIAVDALQPDAEVLARAAAVLRRGGLVAFPTETVYGLGASALDEAAAARIFAAKGRPAGNPLIVHVATVEQARQLVSSWPDVAGRLARRFWPGSLTLVLPKSRAVPDVVTARGPTVALRCPAHAVARRLIEAAALPIAAPSANVSTRVSPTRAEHVLRGLEGRIDMLLDGGPTPGGLESTVLDVTTMPPRLLRPGLVVRHDIEAVVGPIEGGPTSAFAPARSPGMLERHYAPTVPLECMPESWPRVKELCSVGMRVGWLTIGPAPEETVSGVFTVEMPHDPAGYGSQFYAALHSLEAMGLDRIVVERPPDGDAWLAVQDRLRRATTRLA